MISPQFLRLSKSVLPHPWYYHSVAGRWLLCEWWCWIWHFVNNYSGNLPTFLCWNDLALFNCSKWTIWFDCQCLQLPEHMCRGKLFPLTWRQNLTRPKDPSIFSLNIAVFFLFSRAKWYYKVIRRVSVFLRQRQLL